MDKTEKTGGISIERGKIAEKRKKDNFQYKVESATRKGVKSRWMEATTAYCNEYTDGEHGNGKYEFNVGDEVYYFMFADGRGMILGVILRDVD